MNKTEDFSSIIIFIFILFLSCGQEEKTPLWEAREGVLDLRGYSFSHSPPIELKGRWEFFWMELLAPGEFQDTPPPGSYEMVPRLFEFYKNKKTDKNLPGIGFATYRLQVKLKEAGGIYSLRLPEMNTAYRLWIDGQSVAFGGTPGRSREDTIPGYNAKTVEFVPEKNVVELILQISNFHHSKGGMKEAIRWGIPGMIQKEVIVKRGFELFLGGSFFTIGLYHLVLFLLRKIEKTALSFGLLALMFGVWLLTAGERVLFLILPGIPWEILIKIENMAIFFNITLFSILMTDLLKHTYRGFFIFKITGVILTILIFILPVNLFSGLFSIFIWITILFLIYAGFIIRKIADRKFALIPIITGIVFFFIILVLELLTMSSSLQTQTLLPYGVFVLVIALSLLLALRFSGTLCQKEKLSKELEESNKKLEQQNKYKDDFLANISHEFRTPLTGILGLSICLTEGACGRLENPIHQKLKQITTRGKRLSNLIENILEYNKFKQSLPLLNKQYVNIKQLAADILEEEFSLLISGAVKLKNEIKADTPPVEGDPKRLHQIIYNLIENGIKYTSRGYVKIYSHNSDEAVTIIIEDTGEGSLKDIKNKLHGREEETEAVVPPDFIDLGLNLAKHLIELHGKTLNVEPRHPKGMKYFFTLPVYKKSSSFKILPRKKIQAVTNIPIDKNEITILIVDDDMVNLKVVSQQLTIEKIAHKKASSGQEALDILKKDPDSVDLVLLDIMMPGMSGYETCEKIRKELHLNPEDLPVVLLTATNRPQDFIIGFEAGANDFLIKPCYRKPLKARILFHINHSATTKEIKQLKNTLQRRIKDKTLQIIKKDRDWIDAIDLIQPIQTSLLPEKKVLSTFFKEYFTLWRPRDHIGGDFYSFKEIGPGRALFALADCTGHGIPGAFMAMTAYSVLNRTITHISRADPALILSKTNQLMRAALNQHKRETLSNDGMDISLCYIDKNEGTLLFAGARQSLFIAGPGGIKIIKGDKQSLGYRRSDEGFVYKNNLIKITNNMVFYLTSDGYFDQSGSKIPFPLGKKRFKNYLEECCHMSMEDQKNCLEEKLAEYMGEETQRDDITLVGFRF